MQVAQKKQAVSQEKNLIGQIWFKYFPYWPLFLILLLIALTGAWFYIRYKTTPYYIATSSILIKDEKKGQDETKMIESLNQLSAKKIIENEIEVIKSRELLQRVAVKLHLYATLYEKGKIKRKTAYSSSPVIIQAKHPDSLKAVGDVFYDIDPTKTMVVIGSDKFPLNQWVETPYGTLRFVPQNLDKKNVEGPLYFN